MFHVKRHADGATYRFRSHNLVYRKDYHNGKVRCYTIIFKLFGKSHSINWQVCDF